MNKRSWAMLGGAADWDPITHFSSGLEPVRHYNSGPIVRGRSIRRGWRAAGPLSLSLVVGKVPASAIHLCALSPPSIRKPFEFTRHRLLDLVFTLGTNRQKELHFSKSKEST